MKTFKLCKIKNTLKFLKIFVNFLSSNSWIRTLHISIFRDFLLWGKKRLKKVFKGYFRFKTHFQKKINTKKRVFLQNKNLSFKKKPLENSLWPWPWIMVHGFNKCPGIDGTQWATPTLLAKQACRYPVFEFFQEATFD